MGKKKQIVCQYVTPKKRKKVHAKSMTILTFCKTSFKYDLDGCSCFICLAMTYGCS